MPAQAQRSNARDTLLLQIHEAGQAGDSAKGLALSQKLESLVRRQQGAESMDFALALHNEGVFLQNLARYQEAVDKYKAALAIRLRNEDAASILRSSNSLTGALRVLQRRDEAMAVAQRALEIGTRDFGASDVRVSGTLATLGALAREQGNYDEAAGYFERALTSRKKSPQAAPHELAASLSDLGSIYALQGRFDDGEQLLKEALDVLDRGFGANAAPGYDATLGELGTLYRLAGRLTDAEAVLRRAMALAQVRRGELHPDFADAQGALAAVMLVQSRYADGEKLYRQALAIYEKSFGPNDPITAVALANLALTYGLQNRLQEAVGLQQRAVAIHEKASGSDSPKVARSLIALGAIYREMGRSDQALEVCQRALPIADRNSGDGGRMLAEAFSALGGIQTDLGRYDEAAGSLDRALDIRERLFGSTNSTIVHTLREIALLDIKRGNYADAVPRFDRALAISQAKLGLRHFDTISTLVNLADIDGRAGKWAEALEKLRQAAAGMNAQGNQFQRLPDIDPMLIDAIWRVSDGAPDAAAKNEAFGAAQRAYENRAGAALSQMSARFGAGSDAIAALVRRQQDLKAGLESLDKRIIAELGTPEGKRNDTLIANLRAEMARDQKLYDEVLAQLARDFPAYVELSNPAPLSIAQTQSLLKPDEAMVSFFEGGDKSYVFAVTREASAIRQVALGGKAIAERVAKLRLGLADPTAEPPKPFDLDASFDLYNALFGPVNADIAGKPKLLIVPSGALTSLPFHVLLTKKPDAEVAAEDRYRKAAWLLNERSISVMPSVTSLRALRTLAKSSHGSKPFIGFGNPIFQKSPSAARQPARNVQPYQQYYNGTMVDIDRLRRGLPPLPETADELQAVARALGASGDDVRLGAAASVTNVTAAPLDQYRIIEFATHALVAGEINGLTEPALALSLPDNPTSDDDGLLTASRVAKLKLDADWTVLSACNTASGDRPGAEGLSGFARAFFYAGARALLVSHWPVDSDAAVKLTTGAFAAIKAAPGIGRAEALRRSMQALIADRSSPRNAEPSIWAPFVLVGEGS